MHCFTSSAPAKGESFVTYAKHILAATAAALPPELPPAERGGSPAPFNGLITLPKAECTLSDLVHLLVHQAFS